MPVHQAEVKRVISKNIAALWVRIREAVLFC